jgi:hypothetical protein
VEEADAGAVRRRAGYVLLAVGLAALVVVGSVLGQVGGPTRPVAAPTLPASTSAPSTASPTTPPIYVDEVGPIMPGAAGWDLFAQGPGLLAHLELASGRITRTAVPEIASTGPVSVIAGPDRVLIRPLDRVTGYVVVDGWPAEPLNGPTLQSGPLVPGPEPGLAWAESGDPQSRVYTLIDLDGHPAGPAIALPPTAWQAASDGAGGLLVGDPGGTYQATPAGMRRITTGAVLAAGRAGWLVVDCDRGSRCTRALVDRTSWTRRPLGDAPDLRSSAGVIAPDGSVAAIVIGDRAGGALAVHLIDLVSGTDRALPLPVDQAGQPGTLLWAPDSRSLFAISGRRPVLVDARSGTTRVLLPELPPMDLLAFRSS